MDGDNDGSESDFEEGELEAAARLQKATLQGRKNTQMKSKARAVVDDSLEKRQRVCNRCAGEISQFPRLVCVLAPSSTAGKCTDCKKKGKACEDVSEIVLPGEVFTKHRLGTLKRSFAFG